MAFSLREQPWAFHMAEPFFVVDDAEENLLGGGANGAVYRATLRGVAVAAKTHHAIRNPRLYGLRNAVALQTILNECYRELDALSRMGDHPRLVGFKGVAYNDAGHPSFIIMELAEGGTLHDRIHAAPAPDQRS